MNQDHVSPFQTLLGTVALDPAIDRDESAGHMLGSPVEDDRFWDGPQSGTSDCAVKCQQFILDQFTNSHIDENSLCQQAEANGWYDPMTGTPLNDLGNLLDLNGVPVDRYPNATVWQLANELSEGHKVIVAVNAEDLWSGFNSTSILADHALVVSGLDTTDPSHPGVVVNDPGTGEEKIYPMDQFLNAWQTSGFYMVATHDPAPPSVPGMVNFDYDAGHIPSVVDMPYDQFANYSTNQDAFADHVLTPDSGSHTQLDWTVDPSHHSAGLHIDITTADGFDHVTVHDDGADSWHEEVHIDVHAHDIQVDVHSLDDAGPQGGHF